MVQLAALQTFIEQQKPRPVTGAFIKKGESKETAYANGRKMPKDGEFFRLHPMAGWEHLVPLWHEAFGDEAKEFRAVLPFADMEDIFESGYKLFGESPKGKAGNGSLNRVCDGQCVLQVREHSGQFLQNLPTDDNGSPMACCMLGQMPTSKPQCGSRLIGELWLEVPALGQPVLYKVQTGGWADIKSITSGLLSIKETFARLNRLNPEFAIDLQGIPVRVSRRLQENPAQKRDGKGQVIEGQRTTRLDHQLFVDFDPDYYAQISMVLKAQQQMTLEARVGQAQSYLSGTPAPSLRSAAPALPAQVETLEDHPFWKKLVEFGGKVDSLENALKLQDWMNSKLESVNHISGAVLSCQRYVSGIVIQWGASLAEVPEPMDAEVIEPELAVAAPEEF